MDRTSFRPAALIAAAFFSGCSGAPPAGVPVPSGPVPAVRMQASGAYACPNSTGTVRVAAGTDRRTLQTVNKRYLTNDPFYRTDQWDVYAVGLDFAWEYSQPNNGSSVMQPLALGASSVKIAVIDTGADVKHPELSGAKVVYARCFITDPTGAQSTSTFATDRDGHGTAVAGTAAAAINNDVGFVGNGGNVSLMVYRIFPTPNDSCLSRLPDKQCSASVVDVASAVNDAVDNGARVILLGIGGSPCPDNPIEGNAIASAIARNVIVVASSGNGGAKRVGAPACDPGVIAVGASAFADGKRNGSRHPGRGEYVPSYSNWSAALPKTWGLVAPGGDPNCPTAGSCSDRDAMHWVYNIWTGTPYDSRFAGLCTRDPNRPAGPIDCRNFAAGTSLAAAHVAGAAALILSVNAGQYGTPRAMFGLLCNTAANLNAPHQGCGCLDTYRAMAIALHDPNPP